MIVPIAVGAWKIAHKKRSAEKRIIIVKSNFRVFIIGVLSQSLPEFIAKLSELFI